MVPPATQLTLQNLEGGEGVFEKRVFSIPAVLESQTRGCEIH